jgi:hypothetical protein
VFKFIFLLCLLEANDTGVVDKELDEFNNKGAIFVLDVEDESDDKGDMVVADEQDDGDVEDDEDEDEL